jgi:hypothetical protein
MAYARVQTFMILIAWKTCKDRNTRFQNTSFIPPIIQLSTWISSGEEIWLV